MVDFLKEIFVNKSELLYYFITIDSVLLDQERTSASLKEFTTVTGSSQFHAMVFSPGDSSFKAAKRICVCTQCNESFGSCNNFIYSADDNDEQTAIDFIAPNSFVAVAAHEKSVDTLWFIKVIENECIESIDKQDDYGNVILRGTSFIKGHFQEKSEEKSIHQIYKLSAQKTIFYKQSVIYAFVNMTATKKGYELTNSRLNGRDPICRGKQLLSFVIKNTIFGHLDLLNFSLCSVYHFLFRGLFLIFLLRILCLVNVHFWWVLS